MKYLRFYIVIGLLLLFSGVVYSQVDCLTDPPKAPVLTSVSVDPETGNTKFTWTSSTSSDIAAYILYSYNNNGDGMPLDTIKDPSATSWVLSSTATKYFSVSYVIAAMRLPRCTSIFSNVLNSIFEVSSIDTCRRKIIVTWNDYPSTPRKVLNYSILLSVNGGSYTDLGSIGSGTSQSPIDNFTINSEYCFVVRANLENGGNSTSNKSCVSTKMQRSPQWINADQATFTTDGKIALSFSVDPLSELTHFSLQRKNRASGTFHEIAQPNLLNGSVSYTDTQTKPDSIYYYRLSAVNSCNLPVLSSNIASNMVLSLESRDNKINLSWNPYKSWLGSVSSYKLFANTGSGFEERETIPANDTTVVVDYKQIMYEVTGKDVCFYISATEASNPYGITGQSKSSGICTSPIENITVPNLFTPNNDLKNDLFRPVLSFTPTDYHLIISDRRGSVVFESRDYLEAWDGTKNGSAQPQGVFLWFLKLTTPSGKVITKTGTVTIVSK
jgi:gliding motility-associated-like protein